MSPRSRRRQRTVLNKRWSIGLIASLLAVVLAIAGMLMTDANVFGDRWMYGFFALGAIGAVSAMAQTIVRGKAGDDIDEAKL
jgi:hypothetical protein